MSKKCKKFDQAKRVGDKKVKDNPKDHGDKWDWKEEMDEAVDEIKDLSGNSDTEKISKEE